MAAVDISIGHDNDLVIAELVHIELLPYSRAEREHKGIELVIAVYLVGAGLFDIEHLAPHGKYRLEAAVAPLYGRAGGAVALDDVYLAQGRVPLVAVLKLIGHLPALKTCLAPDGLLCLSRGLAGAVCHHCLFKDDLRRGGVLLKIHRELVVDDAVDKRSYICVAELLLRLSFKLRLRQLHGDNGGDTLSHVLAGDLVVPLYYVRLDAVGVDDTGERGFEARLVHAALGRVYVVCEGDECFTVPVVILQRDLRDRVALRAGEVYHILMDGVFVIVEVGDEFAYAALVAELFPLLLPLALVAQGDGQPAVQKRLLAHARVQYLIVVDRVVEHLGVWLEADGRAALVRGAELCDMLHYIAAREFHAVALAVLAYLDLQPLRERIHNGRAHAVQTAGHLVSPAAELTAGVQHREHDLKRALARLLLNIDRNAAAVILHADNVALLYRHVYMRAEPGERFVDGVIHNFIHEVVKPGRRGRPDIHARALSHRLKTFKHLYL